MKLLKDVFKTPFQVMESVIQKDENGIEKEQWVQKYHLYGSVVFSYGKEYELARQEGYHKSARIRTYYGPHITPDMMVILDGEYYNIDNVENIKLEDMRQEIRIYQEVSHGRNHSNP